MCKNWYSRRRIVELVYLLSFLQCSVSQLFLEYDIRWQYICKISLEVEFAGQKKKKNTKVSI